MLREKSLRHTCFHVPHRWLRSKIPKEKMRKIQSAAERRLNEYSLLSPLLHKRQLTVGVNLNSAETHATGERY